MTVKEGLIVIVVGGMFGSEGKGRHVEVLTRHKFAGDGRAINIAVRTGAPNAGHTIHHDGKKFTMQQIPCSWIDPDCSLVLGAGAQVEPHILEREMEMITPYLNGRKLYVDQNAIIQDHTCHEAEEKLGMHVKMGSTQEGCGVALQRRIARDGSVWTFKRLEETEDVPEEFRWLKENTCVVDVSALLNYEYDRGKTILLEGTQGAGLSLYHTPDYPFCTSRDTNAANWLAEAGLSPSLNIEVHLVSRTYPIRVSGNSGLLPKELSWYEFLRKRRVDIPDEVLEDFKEHEIEARNMAMRGEIIPNDVVKTALTNTKGSEKIVPFIEMTSVTKKARRIAELDIGFYEKFLDINRPDVITIQFMDYLDDELDSKLDVGVTDIKWENLKKYLNPKALAHLYKYKEKNYKVDYLGVSPHKTIRII